MKSTNSQKINRFKRRLSKVKILYGLVITFLIFSSLIFGFFKVIVPRFFYIKNIQIEGSFEYINENDFKTVANTGSIGKDIINFEVNKFEDSLESFFLYSREIKVKRVFPDSLSIHVSEREPIAVLKRPSELRFYLTDIDGFILGEVKEGLLNLPVIIYNNPGDIRIGAFLEESRISKYIEVVKALEADNIKIASVESDSDLILLKLANGIEVILSTRKDVKYSVGILKDVLLKYQLENKVLKRIDLRYDNVVVE